MTASLRMSISANGSRWGWSTDRDREMISTVIRKEAVHEH